MEERLERVLLVGYRYHNSLTGKRGEEVLAIREPESFDLTVEDFLARLFELGRSLGHFKGYDEVRCVGTINDEWSGQELNWIEDFENLFCMGKYRIPE